MLDKFKIGHESDTETGTGVTVILCEDGATGGVSVRGSAPGTRETDLLKSENAVSKVNAVVLSGGSAFGLASSAGVMKYLAEKNCGYKAGAFYVPIVCSAVLFDLSYKRFAFPDEAMGYKASQNAAADNFAGGSIGAGTGATVGKMLGMGCCSKSGLGVAAASRGGLEMAAIVAVNALGDVWNYQTNEIVSGARLMGKFINTEKTLRMGQKPAEDPRGTNTTIGCIITNARLTKPEANKLADITHDALGMSIRPVHTMYDGDSIFTLASGEKKCNFLMLSALAVDLMNKAILKAVTA